MNRTALPLLLPCGALGLAALAWSAAAEAASPPAIVPVTGYLTDDQGNPIDDTVEVRARIYTTAIGGTAQFDETTDVDIDLGQFTFYLGDTKTLDLGLFQQNPTLFIGISVDGAAEMAPRFEIGSAPFAANAQYAENAALLEGFGASDFRLNSQAVEWFEISGIPADIADGDANTTYSGGTGITLTGTTFAANQSVIEGWSRGVAYDTPLELTTALGERLLPDVSCNAGEILVSDGTGSWDCDTPFLGSDSIPWSSIVGVPADLADGDDDLDTTYTAGTGLSLTGTAFSVNKATVEGYARGVAYDTQQELVDTLGDRLLPDISCGADQVLVSDGVGGWLCDAPLFVGDAIPWGSLSGVPSGLNDGDQNNVYTAGEGITISGLQVSANKTTIEGYARGVAYDSLAELTTDLNAVYISNQSCASGQLLTSNGAGGWTCTNSTSLALSETIVDGFANNNGYASQTALSTTNTTVSTLSGTVTALDADFTDLSDDFTTLSADVADLSADLAAVQGGLGSGGLVAEFELDEASGIAFADSSGMGNNLQTTAGGISVGFTGHTGLAVNFGGSKGMYAPAGNTIPSPAQIWVEAWIRPEAGTLNATRTILEKAGSYKLSQINDKLEFAAVGANATCTVQHTAGLTAATWTRVAGWYDGLTVSVDINGRTYSAVCNGSSSYGGGRLASSAGGIFSVGASTTNGTTWTAGYAGYIDEIRVRPSAPVSYTKPDLFSGSTILNTDQMRLLNEWASMQGTRWELCYKTGPGETSIANYHLGCRGKGKFIAVAKTSATGKIIGGFNPYGDHKIGGTYLYDGGNSFIFSLTRKEKYQVFSSPQYGVYFDTVVGPSWGGGHDLNIGTSGTTMLYGYCNIRYSYEVRDSTGADLTPAQFGDCTTSGAPVFSDVEVFVVTPGQ